MDKHIHIVALDVPFPPDYGAIIDMYYRYKALTELGYLIHLHCFEYGRGTHHDITGIAHKVHYYTRRKRLIDWFSLEPFIVKTRRNNELLQRLREENYPILWEGQHCTAYLNDPILLKRKQQVRLHNIEWEYYDRLAKRTKNLAQRIFFWSEGVKLKRHEKQLRFADSLVCVSSDDQAYYSKQFSNVSLVRSGFALKFQTELTNDAPYLLFHGNLSVHENDEAVRWIIAAYLKSKSNIPLIIAGKSPSNSLVELINKHASIRLFVSPEAQIMDDLIAGASAHLLITFQEAGLKLKLLISVATAGICIASPEMVAGSGLAECCQLVHNEEAFVHAITELKVPTNEELERRHAVLRNQFDIKKEVIRMMNEIA